MEQQIQLAFFQRLLKGLYVSSCLIENGVQHIPAQVDLGLRAGLFGVENYAVFTHNSLAQAKRRTVYRFFDEYGCHYIFLQLSETAQRYFFIGPYLLALPGRAQILARARSIQASPEQLEFLTRYYTGLPLIEDENLLLSMANTLAGQLWGQPEQFAMEYVDYVIPDQRLPVEVSSVGREDRTFVPDLGTLERNYASEKLLMEAVSKGQLHIVTAVAASVLAVGGQPRMDDSLRSRKNDLIILKTLLRKAAEQGGVHPLHIHNLSGRFADRIEQIRTIKQSLHLQEEMIRSFCMLVKQHSLSKYSYYVGQAITLVQYDLTADLHLSSIAQKLNVNASYLSDLFHKEYGCTLTRFINKERMERGIHLLQTSRKPVQDIAAECGIQDTAYFIRLFKKQTGLTPNQYRASIQPTVQ